MGRSLLSDGVHGALALVLLCCAQPSIASPPANWDGLVQVPAKRADYLYLRPGTDFRAYRAIMLEPTEVAFRKNWAKDINQSRRGVSRISDADVRHAIDEAQGKLNSIFEKRFRETGFRLVSVPEETALRVFVGVANVDVTAPEIKSAGRNRSFSEGGGQATLVIEVRDSLSGELLGRAIEHGQAGDHLMSMRNSVTNWADFEALFDEWARVSATGFQQLLTTPPPR